MINLQKSLLCTSFIYTLLYPCKNFFQFYELQSCFNIAQIGAVSYPNISIVKRTACYGLFS